MVTLVIAGVVLGFALPAFQELMRNNRMVTTSNDLIADLNFARAEAIRVGHIVGVCSSDVATNPNQCIGNWNQGRLVFDDTNNSGGFDAGDTILRSHNALKAGTTLADVDTDGDTETTILFTSRGLIAIDAAGVSVGQGTYAICDSRGVNYGRNIVVTRTGTSRLVKANPALGC